MEIYSIINTLVTIFLGGGWFIYYRANKRKADAQATHEEADGWKAMQDLYQQTIEDFKVYSEDMRAERTVLKKENSEMREKFKAYDEEMIVLKRQLDRQERKIEAITPFLCSVAGCMKRKKFSITGDENGFETHGDVNDVNIEKN